ncbi:SusC/RagA family TonB-linked outer membrane protein [Flavobacterium sp. W22_SRS_FP1]|uniref:SusC/RagA family TonB-linked outer membrane protein n=1 Tax=Flavobacterium sp. W22_SRS_FP1 TaxID=3240276 RepID=UPI003F93E9CE
MIIKKLFKKGTNWCFAFVLILTVFMGNEASAQKGNTITGTVKDASGNTLPGVNIIEKGTVNTVSTDIDGKFALKLTTEKAVLSISYISFTTQNINVAGSKNITIVLKSESESLQEVVVVGYGSVKKTDLTGAVSSLGAADITQRNATNPLEAIQGNIAGVQITSNTGRIGDGYNVTIRGSNSLNGSSPLFIVDGVPTDGIDFLNPQDIARIDVLKDASSAAIYGSRGASGVVIVTTKSGATAKSGISVSLESSFGTKEVARLPKMMSGEKWWYYHQSAYLSKTPLNDTPEVNASSAGNGSGLLASRAASGYTFNWYDAVLDNGITQNNYVNISGRSENGIGYNLGFGVQNETGNIDKEGLNKYSFKAGVNHKINDKFATGANITVSHVDEKLGSDLAMQEAFRLNPLTSPWAIDADGNEIIGELFFQPGKLTYPNGTSAINKTSTLNPLLEIANSTQERKKWKTVGSIFLEYKPITWLSFKTTYSAGIADYRTGEAYGIETNLGQSRGKSISSSMSNYNNFNYTWDNQFNINYTLNKDHVFSFLGLQSLYSNRTETSYLFSSSQPFDTGFYNVGAGAQSTFNVGSSFEKNTLSSYAARINYSYMDKYLVTASNRWDGSSVLSDGNKWEFFPSVALAWKLNKESFLENSSTISDLKLRASIGYTGNDTVDPYSTLNGLNQQTYYDFNSTAANGWLANSLANKELSWEKTRELNFGFDFGFFNNRITGSVDLYDRLSDNLIFAQALPRESGWATTFSNVGSVSNKGFEALITTKNIRTKNVSWETTFTFTKNTNKLVSLYDQKEVDDIGNNLFIGENIHSLYNYVFDGIWQADQATEAAVYNQKPGEARPKDLDNNGKIDADDRTIVGNTDPKWSGSLNSKLTVGNFDFNVSVITNQGVTVLSRFHDNFADTADRGRQKLDLADWYVPENGAGIQEMTSNTSPRPRYEGAYWGSNFAFYKDASFVKVKNISLGYSLDSDLIKKLKISNFRIYANVLDPFVITNYEGYDPEWAAAGLGVGRTASITYQLGLSVKF